MEDSTRNRLTRMLLSKDRRARYIRLFVCLGLCVVVVVAVALHQNGVAMVHEEKVLSCPVTAKVAHTHDESCYDKDGNLVCPLPELKLHTHTKDCYDKDGKLVCDLPEVELHTHTDACYTDVRKLTCGKEESDEHQHTDACYTVTGRELTCGKEEITENHVHGPGCFTTILVPNDEENAAADDAANEPQTAEGVTTNDASSALEGQATVQDGAQDGTAGTTADATQSDAQTDQQSSNVAADAQNNNNANTDAQAAADAQANVDANAQSTTEAQTGTESQTNAQDQNATATDEQKATDEPAKTETPAKDEAKNDTANTDAQSTTETTKTEEQTDAKTDEQAKDAAAAAEQKQEESRPAQEFEQKVLGKDGGVWMVVSVKAPEGAFPAGTTMKATAVEAKNVTAAVGDAVSKKTNSKVTGLAAVDITFYDANGKEIEPAKQIEVKLTNDLVSSKGDVYVVHVDDKGKGGVVNTNSKKNDQLTFGADSFSTYVIATTTLEEVVLASDGRNYRITVTCDEESGIPADARLEVTEIVQDESATDGTTEYDELVARTEDDLGLEPGQINYARFFDINILDAEGIKIQPAEGSTVGVEIRLDDLQAGTQNATDSQVVHFGEKTTEVLSSDVIGETVNFEAASFSVYAVIEARPLPITGDLEATLQFDGNNYCIAYQAGSVAASGLTTLATNGNKRLQAQDLEIRPDIDDRRGNMLVAQGIDLQEWTFEYKGEGKYYIKSKDTGKYLCVFNNGVKLTDTESGATQFSVEVGTGSNEGKYRFVGTVGNDSRALCLVDGTQASGFGSIKATDTNATGSWLSLAEANPNIGDGDFRTYTAYKISLADDTNLFNIKNKAINGNNDAKGEVVLYTRVWNDEALRYDFYVIDYDGTLIQCYTSGDTIQWVGLPYQTATWEFTEYRNSDNSPNYYYELENIYARNSTDGAQLPFIAPKIENKKPLSKGKIGVNMPGRQGGRDYTKIMAWDSKYYIYAGLKVEPDDKGYRMVSCPGSEAVDIYFAVLNKTGGSTPSQGKLHTVETLDNNDFGITMQMVDFNNPKQSGKNRDSIQNPFLGDDSDGEGIVSTQLRADGYPTVMRDNATGKDQSLGVLYETKGATKPKPVNHLFLTSIYEESGYFEYDSTQNFAYLQNDGNFKVYKELGCMDDAEYTTRQHGQFMPYNDIINCRFSERFTNQTDVLAEELSDLNPRKGEKMYRITNPDYFFGMKMDANFTQTPSGVDAWGHDIIFEFSGDDDFWLYVDGELVLDIGGVHSASTGTVNFRTGEVKIDRIKFINNMKTKTSTPIDTTLYELFRKNYKNRGMTDDEIKDKLDGTDVTEGIFTEKEIEVNGETKRVHVFKDYTPHKMSMFYMERGASASNLHMRFNLAADKPGTVTLKKNVKNSAGQEQNNIYDKFPYQIFCHTSEYSDDGYYRLLSNTDTDCSVKYKGSSDGVDFKETYTPAGGNKTYKNVFFLKPTEEAEIVMPEGTDKYIIVECDVDSSKYTKVQANNTAIQGVDASNHFRTSSQAVDGLADVGVFYTFDSQVGGDEDGKDFIFTGNLIDENTKCQQVTYINTIDTSAVASLQITKKLLKEDGATPLTEGYDPTQLFAFRLSLGSKDDAQLSSADRRKYLVKDPNGTYCEWIAGQGFVKLPGATDIASLYEKYGSSGKHFEFETSMNYGSIAEIPAYHTIEVIDLPIGTKYKVEERDNEVPAGYSRIGYRTYTLHNTASYSDSPAPVEGEIESASAVPVVEIRNQCGWGIKANKVWSDETYMSSHDPVYFAVFTDDGNGQLTRTSEPVKQVTKERGNTAYWYITALKAGSQFNQYVVREVTIGNTTNSDVKADGSVENPGTVTVIQDGGELTLDAVHVIDNKSKEYTYKVHYTDNSSANGTNVREFTVTNSRSGGIRLKKVDANGMPLAGAVFTLTRKAAEGAETVYVGAASYESDSDGLITVAYLPDDLSNGTYVLTEIKAPNGYQAVNEAITLTVDNDNKKITASDGVTVVDDGDGMFTITLTNRKFTARIMKKDEDIRPLSGAKFSLYPQVTDGAGNKVRDRDAVTGYKDLVSGDDGSVGTKGVDGFKATDLSNLNAGSYYLVETQAPSDSYAVAPELNHDNGVVFTVSSTGRITLEDTTNVKLTQQSGDNGATNYVINVTNKTSAKDIIIRKVNLDKSDSEYLNNAEFKIYAVKNGKREDYLPYTSYTLTTRSIENIGDGVLAYQPSGNAYEYQFKLGIGEYELVETKAPDGYNPSAEPVKISVTYDNVTYDDGTTLSSNGGRIYDVNSRQYTLKVSNSKGNQLPATGGVGTLPTYVAGGLLVAIALVMHHRMKTAKGV